MNGAKWYACCLLPAVLLLASCNRKPKAAEEEVLAPLEIVEHRTSLAGRWKLEVTEGESRIPIALLDVAPDGDRFKVTLAAVAHPSGAARLEQTQASGNDLQTVIDLAGQKFQFAGTFRENRVWGNLTIPATAVLPAMLIPSSLTTLQGAQPEPLEGRDALREAITATDSVAALEKFAAEHSESPLSLVAYRFLLLSAKSKGLSAEKVGEIVHGFREAAGRWGPRLQTSASVESATTLAVNSYQLELAEQQAKLAASELTDDSPEIWRISLGDTEIRLGHAAAGLAFLEPLYAKNPNNPRIELAVARGRDLQGDKQGALELYTRLAVSPGGEPLLVQAWPDGPDELPTHAAARLWAAEHGSEEGFTKHLADAFHDLVHSYARPPDAAAAKPDGARVVLVELFTGTSCPGCVAADFAAGAAQSSYPPEKLLLLRYYTHNPAPDPLATEAGSDRYRFYEADQMPTITVNGTPLTGLDGVLDHVPQSLERLAELIDRRIADDTEVRIELSAQPAGERIKFSANVLGLKPIPEKARLRLVVVEDGVAFLAPNGIRIHDEVVRSMPAGARGVPAREGKLSFADSISTAELREDLGGQLDYVEERSGMKFPVRPLSLAALRLVAFVQDDETKEILQAASIPLPRTPAAAATEPGPAASAEDSEAAPATPDDLTPAAPATPE